MHKTILLTIPVVRSLGEDVPAGPSHKTGVLTPTRAPDLTTFDIFLCNISLRNLSRIVGDITLTQ